MKSSFALRGYGGHVLAQALLFSQAPDQGRRARSAGSAPFWLYGHNSGVTHERELVFAMLGLNRKIILCGVLLWTAFAGVGLSLHVACRNAPRNHLGWTDIAGYDSEGYVTWFNNVGSLFQVNHRHPVIGLVLSPVTVVGSFVGERMGDEAGKCAAIVAFSLLGAVSFLLLWVIVTDLGGDGLSRFGAAAIYLSFAHVWLLGGLAESFVASQLLLIAVVRMVQRQVRDGRLWLLMAALCGGVTITNGIKPLLAWLVGAERDSEAGCACRKELGRIACWIAALAAVGALGVCLKWRLVDGYGVATGMRIVADDIAACWLPQDVPFAHRLWLAWNAFWCEPMMLHGAVVGMTAVASPYATALPHLAAGGVLALCIVSVVRNWRHPLVWPVLAMVSVDIGLHVVAGWGLAEGQIYCGHWIWAIPILLALLPRCAAGFILILAAVIAVHNLAGGFAYVFTTCRSAVVMI